MISLDILFPCHFGDGPGRLHAPNLELEKPVPGGVESLSEKEVPLVLGIDVTDAPPIDKYFYFGRQSSNLEFQILEVLRGERPREDDNGEEC
jgi:hypothetical protein